MAADGPVLGIDLGTTNSAVAVVLEGEVRVLADEEGQRLVPSAVAFLPDGRVLVGRKARDHRRVDPSAAIYSIKRLLARPFHSEEAQKSRQRAAFLLEEDEGGGIVIRVAGQRYALTEISALVLRHVRDIAENALGAVCARAVITVPANFTQAQRQATKVAAKVAGLDALRIINEPTAAALAYGYSGGSRERIAVYDFGGGTFDLTILELAGDVFEVIATAGDMFLGGDDIDLAIADRLADYWKAKHGDDPRADARAFEGLRAAAEIAKCRLSTEPSVDVVVKDAGGKRSINQKITRDELDEWIRPLIARSRQVCQSAMRRAGVSIEQLDNVILVGGTSRIPLVRREVAEFFARAPISTLDPDLLVAHGAAVYAASLAADPAARERIDSMGGIRLSYSQPPGEPMFDDGAEAPTAARQSPFADKPSVSPHQRVSTQPGWEAPTAEQVTTPGARVFAEAVTTPGARSPFEAPTVAGVSIKDRLSTLSDLPGEPTVPRTARPVDPLTSAPTVSRQTDPTLRAVSGGVGSGAREVDFGDDRFEELEPPPAAAETRPPPGRIAIAPDFPAAPEPERKSGAPERESPSSEPRISPVPERIAGVPADPTLEPHKLPPLRGTELPARLSKAPVVQPPPPRGSSSPGSTPSAEVMPASGSASPTPGKPSRRMAVAASDAGAIPLPNRPPPLLLDVTASALGVETTGGWCEPVIPPNTAVPVEQSRDFTTAADGQEIVRVRVCQGDSGRFEENELLGEFELSGLPPAPRGEVKIEVTFIVDPDGTLGVTARDTQTGRAQQIRIHLLGDVDDRRAAEMRARQDQLLARR